MAARLGSVADLIWGTASQDAEIVRRWLQGMSSAAAGRFGFEFHDAEPSALVQHAGGPCGVIAPVQAFLLKHLIYPEGKATVPGGWRTPKDQYGALVSALTTMLLQAAMAPSSPAKDAPVVWPAAGVTVVTAPLDAGDQTLDDFHQHAQIAVLHDQDMIEPHLLSLQASLQHPFAVVALVYSLVLTRGTERLAEDMGVEQDSLISAPFGHCNQALLNLALTGTAVPNVWDGDNDMGGLALRGLPRRSTIGYLTLLESLRYCTCGSYFKNPEFPIWVLGSETHFTLLFSLDSRLVVQDSPRQHASTVFDRHDANANGFLMPEQLPALLDELQLLMEDNEARTRLVSALDRDGLGIVLKPQFLAHFYKAEGENGTPEQFVVYHYNGIAQPGSVVRFVRGQAKAESPTDVGATDVMRILWSKWTKLQVQWDQSPRVT
ncbi:uncharacterized protein MONBRDRAFT_28423 [Monosiga brevicollis MX1]|uniref:ubiquitinyl hydrolase 1 n=1 Tax=Monosiga brevicollis TaxID=81824 RepID=A9V848_MONBE|nr:uncharacterized protein MONBRDRAFT_28423 [Monosiga brevicollis MX1]EDQ86208.1 predicted protein [Monosiga brevicollis MX1]|eukprot:XP_001748878.1 hypothetical protein [Monosiga brevicollis MX1]